MSTLEEVRRRLLLLSSGCGNVIALIAGSEEGSSYGSGIRVVGSGGCEDDDVLVLRQDDGASTLRHIEAEAEHIGELIGHIASLRMAVCADVGDVCRLQVALCLAFVTPLSDETSVIRHVDGLLALTKLEGSVAVIAIAGSQKIDMGELSFGQVDGIAIAGEAIGSTGLAQGEGHVVAY